MRCKQRIERTPLSWRLTQFGPAAIDRSANLRKRHAKSGHGLPEPGEQACLHLAGGLQEP